MKIWIFSACMALQVTLALKADVVELQDGARIEGTILAENPDSIEIQVGTNETGSIRQVLIIDASEIRTWMADAAGRLPGSEKGDVNRLDGKSYIDGLIREAQAKIDALQYDAGIREFGQAADVAGRDIEKLEPADQVEMLEMKAYATRLQLAALEGKKNMLEGSAEGVEEKLEEMEKDLERDLRDFQEDKEEFMEEFADRRLSQFGERQGKSDLDVREQHLKRRQMELTSIRQNVLTRLRTMEQDLAQTEMQIELAEQRVDQAEDEAKRAERSLRRR